MGAEPERVRVCPREDSADIAGRGGEVAMVSDKERETDEVFECNVVSALLCVKASRLALRFAGESGGERGVLRRVEAISIRGLGFSDVLGVDSPELMAAWRASETDDLVRKLMVAVLGEGGGSGIGGAPGAICARY